MMNTDDLREQIRRAVEHARELAYRRSMEGGYHHNDDDEYDYEGGLAKGSRLSTEQRKLGHTKRGIYGKHEKDDNWKIYNPENKPKELSWAKYRHDEKEQNRHIAGRLKKINARANATRHNRFLNSQDLKQTYSASPVLYNPRYRKYVAYVNVGDRNLKLERLNKAKKVRTSVVLTGTPAAAARKVVSVFLKNYTGGQRGVPEHYLGDDKDTFVHVRDELSSGKHVKVMLVEITRGVRHYSGVTKNKLKLKVGASVLDSYYTYHYLISNVELNNAVTYTASGKNITVHRRSIAYRVPLRLVNAPVETILSYVKQRIAKRAPNLAKGRATLKDKTRWGTKYEGTIDF